MIYSIFSLTPEQKITIYRGLHEVPKTGKVVNIHNRIEAILGDQAGVTITVAGFDGAEIGLGFYNQDIVVRNAKTGKAFIYDSYYDGRLDIFSWAYLKFLSEINFNNGYARCKCDKWGRDGSRVVFNIKIRS